MWNEIKTQAQADAFMEGIYAFHDSCIKEMSYLSGAYVDADLSMRPINEQRVLRVLLQRQFEAPSMIELVFVGLKLLKLPPADGTCTCEILEATLLVEPDRVLWYDWDGMTPQDMLTYEGTVICAEKVVWRPVEGFMGNDPFYLPADGGWGKSVDRSL